MANNIYWGQGANRNIIGWGQGAYNEIGWGASHIVSWSPETDLYGISGGMATNFYLRVIADSAEFEADSCLLTTLNNINV